MYLSEVSPPKIRGSIVFLFQLAITFGLLSAFVVNYLLEATEGWRWMFAVAIVPSVALGLTMIPLPSSPRWLVLRGREREAESNLQRLRGSLDVSGELSDIKESVSRSGGGLRELFSAKLFPLVVITVGLFEFQQLSGINTIFYYAPTIFAAGGFFWRKVGHLGSCCSWSHQCIRDSIGCLSRRCRGPSETLIHRIHRHGGLPGPSRCNPHRSVP
jgi:SP family galactose:H+ symporter-like MFS transporter